MEGKVPAEFRIDKWILLLACLHRVDGFHTAIETDNQIIQVEADA